MMIHLLCAIAVLAGLLAASAIADVPAASGIGGITRVRVLESVEVLPGSAITLGDVAQIAGPLADRLGGLVLVEAADDRAAGPEPVSSEGTPAPATASPGVGRIGLEQIREAIEGELGRRSAFVDLRGGAVAIRWLGVDRVPVTPGPDAYRPISGTLGDLVRRRIRSAVDLVPDRPVAMDDLVLVFDRRDAAFLSMGVQGLTVVIEPRGMSRAMPITVTLYRVDRLVESRTITVSVHVRRACLIAGSRIERGQPIERGGLLLEERALAPNVVPATEASVVGMIARSNIHPGELITDSQLNAELAAEPGDPLRLDVLVGGFRLTFKARARERGREGETILVRMEPTGRELRARLVGQRHAVHASDAIDAEAADAFGRDTDGSGDGGLRMTRGG